jgi:hypothetical protein
MEPAYTDLKLHTMANGPADPIAEPNDQNQPAGSLGFFAGKQKFITRKLWGLYNSGPFGHAGKFTTMRDETNFGHNGEATACTSHSRRIEPSQQDDVIEFLKSLRVLPPGTSCQLVNDRFNCLNGDDVPDHD